MAPECFLFQAGTLKNNWHVSVNSLVPAARSTSWNKANSFHSSYVFVPGREERDICGRYWEDVSCHWFQCEYHWFVWIISNIKHVKLSSMGVFKLFPLLFKHCREFWWRLTWRERSESSATCQAAPVSLNALGLKRSLQFRTVLSSCVYYLLLQPFTPLHLLLLWISWW